MIPAAFDYVRPASVAEAVELLAQHGADARPLAGGQSLIPLLRERKLRPRWLVDLGTLPGLDGIGSDGGSVSVGALATHHRVATAPELAPLAMFADAGARIGDVQVRNWGTLAGSLAHADPAGDWAPVALAAGAALEIAGPAGPRTVPIDEFFRAPYTTTLRPAEIITAVRVPPAPGCGSAYVKLADGASGTTVAGVAVLLTGHPVEITAARVAVTGVAPTPRRLPAAEQALTGRPSNPGAAASGTAEVISDQLAGADYRRQLLTVACHRAVTAAAARLRTAVEGNPWPPSPPG